MTRRRKAAAPTVGAYSTSEIGFDRGGAELPTVLWCAWRLAERAQAGADPDGWGVVTHGPAFVQARMLGINASVFGARSTATLAALTWLEVNAPETHRGCAWVDSLAVWWLGRLTARGAVPRASSPAPADTGPLAALGLAWPCDRAAVVAAYRARARTAHPDGGGTDAAFIELHAAYQRALQLCEVMS